MGLTQIFRKSSFFEKGLYFVCGLCRVHEHLVPCIWLKSRIFILYFFFEDNPWTELFPEHMHLAEKINVWSEAVAHLWLRVFVNGVPGKAPVCFNSSYHHLKMKNNWVLSIWKMQAFCDECVWYKDTSLSPSFFPLPPLMAH